MELFKPLNQQAKEVNMKAKDVLLPPNKYFESQILLIRLMQLDVSLECARSVYLQSPAAAVNSRENSQDRRWASGILL